MFNNVSFVLENCEVRLFLFRTFNPSGNISSSLPSSVFTKGIDQEILDYCVEDNTHPEKRVHNLNINMKTKKIHPPTETYYIKQKMFSCNRLIERMEQKWKIN